MSGLGQIKRRLFPKGVKRSLTKTLNRAFHRSNVRLLSRTFSQLGMDDRSLVCVHSMLSSLGHLVGGGQTVITVLQEAVPGCTLMMPTFTFGESCQQYLATDPVFDPRQTPSVSGMLTNLLWQQPGALRSIHPTHPCAALGPRAEELIAGSEHVITPFADDSTYGRFADDDDGILLLIHTNNTSLVHRFQERAGTPNLFLPDTMTAKGLDVMGLVQSYDIKVHRPKLPLYVIMAGDQPGDREYIWLPDYCLPSPGYNRQRILANRQSRQVGDFLLARHQALVDQGIIRSVFLRQAEIQAVRVKPFMARICADLQQNYAEFSDEYALAALQAKDAAGLLHK